MSDALAALTNLLSKENVKQIVYIDDAHNNVVDYLNSITAAILKLGEDGNLNILIDTYGEIDFSTGDGEIVNNKINELWPSWPNEKRFSYYVLVLEATGNKEELEKAPRETILSSGPFKDLITFLSPQEWIQQQTNLLATASDANRIIILMDQELGLGAARKGIHLLKDIVASNFTYLTLFTYSITLNEEVSTRNSLSSDHS